METIKNMNNWPHKWFGFWKEYGQAYEKYPSILDFVDKQRNSSYEKARLKQYLENGIVVVTTSRINFPSPFTGKIGEGDISWRTDGTWVWFDDLFEYIDHHDLAIPDEWYEHIKYSNFEIPEVDELDMDKLDLPNL
jgi:hypothetical protein